MKEKNIFVKKRMSIFVIKSGWIFSFFLFFFSTAGAQVNYVHNPSFEQYWRCPFDWDQIMYANFWSAIDSNWSVIDTFGDGNCSPEYCNTCDTYASSDMQIPSNPWFNHYPRTGNGMVHMQMFYDDIIPWPYQRDYLQGRLYKPLTAGISYCVTFYVTLTQRSKYAINHIGMYLDNGQIDTAINTCGIVKTQYTPQVVETAIINDTLNWVKIEGSFIANGTEKFITIGNFYNKANTSYIVSNPNSQGNFTWYLVDDVSVIESGTVAYAGNDTTIVQGDSVFLGEIAMPYEWYKIGSTGLSLIDSTSGGIWIKPDSNTTYVVKQTLCGVVSWDSIKVSVVPVSVNKIQLTVNSVTVWPNPNNGCFTVSGIIGDGKEAGIEIFNAVGQIVYRGEAKPQNNKFNKGVNLNLSRGIYLLKVSTENDRITTRFVINQ